MDKQITTDFGRSVRVKAFSNGAFIQIRDAEGKELASVALNGVELQKVFSMINEATGVVE